MVTACGYVLMMQLLEILTVVRYHAQALLHGIGKLVRVRLTQATNVSRRDRSESPRGNQFSDNNAYVLIQVYCCEQFTVHRCLTLGWMSSSGTLFLMMYSFISSLWSQK